MYVVNGRIRTPAFDGQRLFIATHIGPIKTAYV